MSRLLAWLENHRRLAVWSFLVGLAGVLIAFTGFIRDIADWTPLKHEPTAAAGPAADAAQPNADIDGNPAPEPTTSTPSPEASPKRTKAPRVTPPVTTDDDNGLTVNDLASPVVVPPASVLYLDEEDEVQSSGDTMSFGPTTILKESYQHSVALCADGIFGSNRCANNGNATWIEYNVPAGYRVLSGNVGLTSDAPASCRLSAQIMTDGTARFDRELQLGEAYPISFDVATSNRVRLQMHALDGEGRCDLAFANFRFRR
ncbi:hypothetical protein AB0J80_27910 [Actinoplanes sp. NPDC049548]|uniref:hypothetical protein n=1 Tax=Actinoplanes sp. NPDC049548 TaxID=3155152 RepID=UPI003446288C